MLENELRSMLIQSGADAVQFCDLGDAASPDFPDLHYAVTIIKALSRAVTDTIHGAPTAVYFHHYRTVNTKLDLLALDASSFIEKSDYRALPVAASQSMPGKENYRGIFPHKTAAVLSGAGFVGKSGLLITKEYGARVRLATVLTDMPLTRDGEIIANGCGSCTLCVDACPAGAITGALYSGGNEPIINVRSCSDHMKKAYQDIGRGSVCGICMAVCPYTKR